MANLQDINSEYFQTIQDQSPQQNPNQANESSPNKAKASQKDELNKSYHKDDAFVSFSKNQEASLEYKVDNQDKKSEDGWIDKKVKSQRKIIVFFKEQLTLENYITKHIHTQETKDAILDKSHDFEDSINFRGEKIGAFATFFAIIKGYATLIFLVLPKAFSNGGWAFSTFCIMFGGFLSCYCALKLVNLGNYLHKYDYSTIVQLALGRTGQQFLDLMIFLTQVGFVITYVTFIYQASSNISAVVFGYELQKLEVGIACILIFTALTLVRKIETFSFAYIVGTFLMVGAGIVIVQFCLAQIITREAPVSGFVAFNSSSFYTMIGFSFYTYEGIGMLMPIMNSSNCPEKFPTLFTLAISCLAIIYSSLGVLGYYAYGDDMSEQFIFEKFPQDNPIVFLIQILFLLNLFCTFPIAIYPANTVLEDYLLANMKKGKVLTLLQRLLRFQLVAGFVTLALLVAEKLDKFLSLFGALLCAPLVITLPCLCSIYLRPESTQKVIENWLFVGFSAILVAFCTATTIMGWNS